MKSPRPGQEGQIAPALLLVVVALLFLGLLFAQVGSASEQKTQTQTAADSAAVAATHQLRDATILDAAEDLPPYLAPIFAPLSGWQPELTAAACAAAQRNWESNPHEGAGLGCGDISLAGTGDGIEVGVIAPPGQVVEGPADVEDARARASAVSRIHFVECPEFSNPKRAALAHWIIDATMARLGHTAGCFTSADGLLFSILALTPLPVARAIIGPPEEILDEVRASLRIEIIG